jgi:hypothetical protein
MPYGTYSTPVNAPAEKIWETLLDKARRPHKYIPYEILEFKIHEESPDGLLREMRTSEAHVLERVKFDKQSGTITFTLVDHPLYEGAFTNRVSPPTPESGGLPVIAYTVDVTPRSPEAEKQPEAKWFHTVAQPDAVAKAVLHMKGILEGEASKTARRTAGG